LTKTVSHSRHAKDRSPFSNQKIQWIFEQGKGWRIFDKQNQKHVLFYDGWAIVYVENESHFKIITSYYEDRPDRFIMSDRYDVISK